MGKLLMGEVFDSLPRKAGEIKVPVPADTGRRGENLRCARTLVKELGKMTRNFGRRVLLTEAAVNRPKRLFSGSLRSRKAKYKG